MAVCDDIVLQKRLAAQLEADLTELFNPYDGVSEAEKPEQLSSTSAKSPKLVHLALNPENPDLPKQIVQWVKQHRPPRRSTPWTMPDFQILGVEQLTRQPAAVQRRFLDSLQHIEALLPRLESNLLLWLPWPWFRTIQQSVPEFWQYHSGVFEFAGEPTPVTALQTGVDPLQNAVAVPVAKLTHQAVPTKATSLTQTRPPKSTATTAPAKLPTPPLPDGAESGAKSSLWNILTEDLAKLDRDHPVKAAPPTGKAAAHTSTPKPLKPPQQSAPPPPADAPKAPHQSSKQARARPPQVRRSLPTSAPSHPNQAAPKLPANPRLVSPAAKATPPASQAAGANLKALSKPIEPAKVAAQSPASTEAMEPRLLSLLQRIERLQQQQASPAALANAYLALGQLYRDRIEVGDNSPQILAASIQAYVQGLHWLPKESLHWRDSVNDLGSLYWLKAQQSNSPDQAVELMRQSIKTYRTALTNPHAPQPT